MKIGDRVVRHEDSKRGEVTGIGSLYEQQTVSVTFDDGTFSASNSYASEFQLEELKAE